MKTIAAILLFLSGTLGIIEKASEPPSRGNTAEITEIMKQAETARLKKERERLVVPPDALCPQYWEMAVKVGWPVEHLPMIDRIIKRESGCGPNAHNKQDPMSGSRGLMQINGSWHKWLRNAGIINAPEDLFIPEVNLRAGLAIYNYSLERQPSCGWYPWRMC